MKEFKTHNQQLNILRSRGLDVPKDGKPKRFLEQHNYYNVINGYKHHFLVKDANRRPVEPEQYIENSHFDELKYLYLLDKDLKSCLLKYLLIFENSIKTLLAHEFPKMYRAKNAYLDFNNYISGHPNKVLRQISNFTSIIHKKVDKDESIKHYISQHEEVPLWVLINHLTIGNISYFYSVLVDELKNRIAKVYSERFNKDYNAPLYIHASDLESILKAVNLTRNPCAHDERLYNRKLKDIRVAPIAKQLNIPREFYKNNRVVVIIIFLKAVLRKSDFKNFLKELEAITNKYQNRFHTISFNEIYREIGILDQQLLDIL